MFSNVLEFVIRGIIIASSSSSSRSGSRVDKKESIMMMMNERTTNQSSRRKQPMNEHAKVVMTWQFHSYSPLELVKQIPHIIHCLEAHCIERMISLCGFGDLTDEGNWFACGCRARFWKKKNLKRADRKRSGKHHHLSSVTTKMNAVYQKTKKRSLLQWHWRKSYREETKEYWWERRRSVELANLFSRCWNSHHWLIFNPVVGPAYL